MHGKSELPMWLAIYVTKTPQMPEIVKAIDEHVHTCRFKVKFIIV